MTKVYTIIYTNSYIKRASKFIKKHPELEGAYTNILKILELNPFHKSLKLHPLSGKLKGLHAVAINISYRITLELVIHKKTITPIKIGTHSEVY